MNKKLVIKVDRTRILICLFCVVQKLLFEYIYVNIIYPAFRYYGFMNDFDMTHCVISWFLYLPVLFFTIKAYEDETFSKMTVALILNITYTPCLILYEYYLSTPFIMMLVVYYLVMMTASIMLNSVEFKIRKNQNTSFEKIANIIGILFGLVVFFIWGFYTNFHLQLGFSDVYETRFTAREMDIPKVFFYLRTMARTITPVLAIYNLYKARKWLFFYFAFVQFVQFCIDGTKSVVFTFAIGLIAYFFSDRNIHIVNNIPKFMSAGAALAIIENRFLNSSVISNFFFRRVMFVPALLNYYYYDIAQQNGFDYYRQSIKLLGESQYTHTIPQTVAGLYFKNGEASASANNGVFADAYVNLGFIGCLIMPFLVVLVFKLIEGASAKLPKSIWIVSAIQFFYSFTESSFFIVLLTHGALLVIVLLYLLTPNEDEYSSHRLDPA